MNQKTKMSFLSLVGLGRRAGVVVIGQDRVLPVLKKNKRYMIILSSDRSDSLARSLEQLAKKSGHSIFQLEDIDREELGRALGLNNCQVLAIPSNDGLANKISCQFLEGGKAFE